MAKLHSNQKMLEIVFLDNSVHKVYYWLRGEKFSCNLLDLLKENYFYNFYQDVDSYVVETRLHRNVIKCLRFKDIRIAKSCFLGFLIFVPGKSELSYYYFLEGDELSHFMSQQQVAEEYSFSFSKIYRFDKNDFWMHMTSDCGRVYPSFDAMILGDDDRRLDGWILEKPT